MIKRILGISSVALLVAACDMAMSTGSVELTWEYPNPPADHIAFNVYEVTCDGDVTGDMDETLKGEPRMLDAQCSTGWVIPDSPLAQLGPDVLTYSMSGVDEGWHYWAVTSLDDSGLESGLSNVGGKDVMDEIAPAAPTNLIVE